MKKGYVLCATDISLDEMQRGISGKHGAVYLQHLPADV